MDAPEKKKRGRPRGSGQAVAKPNKPTSSTEMPKSISATAPAHPADHPYQYVEDIEMQKAIDNANDNDLDSLFDSINGGPGDDHIFLDPDEQNMVAQLIAFNERGPSPTQGNDEGWNQMMQMQNGQQSTTAQPHLQDSELSFPDLTTDTTNTADNPTTNPSAQPDTSPVTPRHPSRPMEAQEKGTSSSLKHPKSSPTTRTSGFAAQDDSTPVKSHNGQSNGSATKGFSEPPSLRRSTPNKPAPVLGSPFQPSGAPARQSAGGRQDMSDSPPSTRPQQTSFSNMPMSSNLLPGSAMNLGGPMPSMGDPRFQAAAFNFHSPPNPATFTEKLQNGNLFQYDPAMAQPQVANPMHMGPAGQQQGDSGTITMDQHVQREQQIYQQNQRKRGMPNSQMTTNEGGYPVNDWVRSQKDNIPSPPEMSPPGRGQYKVPRPTGSLSPQEETDERMTGKPTDLQISPGETGENKTESFPPLNVTPTGMQAPGLFLNRKQEQYQKFLQHQEQQLRQYQMANGINPQGPTFQGNQFSPPMRGFPSRQVAGQGQQQMNMSMVPPFQDHFQQTSPSPQMGHMQRPQQGQLTIPRNLMTTPTKMVQSSPSGPTTVSQPTSTPVTRRRDTSSKPSPRVTTKSTDSPAQAAKNVTTTPSRKRAQSQMDPGSNPQSRAGINDSQAKKAKISQVPDNVSAQADVLKRTSITTPPFRNPAALHAHLPTPQQPISTGSCPNTENETLEETNRRTAAELQALGAPVRDFVPGWNPIPTVEEIWMYESAFGFPKNQATNVFGSPGMNMNFNNPMMAGMGSGTTMNMGMGIGSDMANNMTNMNGTNGMNSMNMGAKWNMNHNANQNMTVNMNGQVNPFADFNDPPVNNNNMVMASNVLQNSPSMSGPANTTKAADKTNLQNSVLNSSPNMPSIGYAETVKTDTPRTTPAVNSATSPDQTIATQTLIPAGLGAGIDAPIDQSAVDDAIFEEFINEEMFDGAADLPMPNNNNLPVNENHNLDPLLFDDWTAENVNFDWADHFDETKPWDAKEWGFADDNDMTVKPRVGL